jgi:hypothetical protein
LTGLIAEADILLRDGRLLLGRSESIISASYDPLSKPPGEYYEPSKISPTGNIFLFVFETESVLNNF